MRHATIKIRPGLGGHLLTDVSAENAGIQNYILKRNWRRKLDVEVRREGHDYFWPISSGGFATNPGHQPFPLEGGDTGPIILNHELIRPDGARAIIVGTPTRLYWFAALENGDYFAEDGTPAEYFVTDPLIDPNAPYFITATDTWQVIGRFATGGNRWQAVNLNGYAVFNNGVDLPVTWALGDPWVTPIHELREVGYSRVGTIAVYNGVLMLGDLTEIESSKLQDLFRPIGIRHSGSVLASQPGGVSTTLTATSPVFVNPDDVGRRLIMENGAIRNIAAVLDASRVTVEVGEITPPQRFTFRDVASQTGALYSCPTAYAHTVAASNVITARDAGGAPVAFFNAPWINTREVYLANGWHSTITGVGGVGTTCTVADNAPETWDGLPFWVVRLNGNDHTVTSLTDIFRADMIGSELSWDSGETRLIMTYLNARNVVVDAFLAQPAGPIVVIDPDSYGRYPDTEYELRFQKRLGWSALDEPRIFGPLLPGSITAGSNQVTLDYPVESISHGDGVIVQGAGPGGTDLVAIAVFVAAHRILVLDEFASTTVTSTPVQRLLSSGTISGYRDLEDDEGAIMAMACLQGVLVVHKESSISLVHYQGDIAAPFQFQHRPVPVGRGIYYRHTLTTVADSVQFYAGAKSLFRYDLSTPVPVEIPAAQGCNSILLGTASIDDTESVFASYNPQTREVWFVQPKVVGVTDSVLCFDEVSGTFSTMDVAVTACGVIRRPMVPLPPKQRDFWFLMGIGTTLCVYGLADEPVAAWSNAQAIWYRRQANPFSATKDGYESRLHSGLTDFANDFDEKHLRSYLPFVGAGSVAVILDVELVGSRNTADTLESLCTQRLIAPDEANLIPTHFVRHYIGDRIVIPATVSGGAPYILTGEASLAGRAMEVGKTNSRSFVRHL
jgi:hypothetical protein